MQQLQGRHVKWLSLSSSKAAAVLGRQHLQKASAAQKASAVLEASCEITFTQQSQGSILEELLQQPKLSAR
jgi:hypothetical protein